MNDQPEVSAKLSDMNLFAGRVESLTVSDFRSRPGDILLQVQMGKTFNITKNGKIIAILSKPEPTALELGAEIRRLKLL